MARTRKKTQRSIHHIQHLRRHTTPRRHVASQQGTMNYSKKEIKYLNQSLKSNKKSFLMDTVFFISITLLLAYNIFKKNIYETMFLFSAWLIFLFYYKITILTIVSREKALCILYPEYMRLPPKELTKKISEQLDD